ncbi:unnamed protein product [Paramecium sonneborni]|uniref:Uncharacterized protein n=1 Tax=Paramecium sonneborni TaxID=65129 RepID=A0A8S1P6N2_9CILI|nr:unnamed protein product [Paramecium sonneborni]
MMKQSEMQIMYSFLESLRDLLKCFIKILLKNINYLQILITASNMKKDRKCLKYQIHQAIIVKQMYRNYLYNYSVHRYLPQRFETKQNSLYKKQIKVKDFNVSKFSDSYKEFGDLQERDNIEM